MVTLSTFGELFFAVSRCLVLLHFSSLQLFDQALTSLHSGVWFLRNHEKWSSQHRIHAPYQFALSPSWFFQQKWNIFHWINAVSYGYYSFSGSSCTVKDIRPFTVECVDVSFCFHKDTMCLPVSSILQCVADCIWDVASDRSMDCLVAWAISLKPVIALYWCKRGGFSFRILQFHSWLTKMGHFALCEPWHSHSVQPALLCVCVAKAEFSIVQGRCMIAFLIRYCLCLFISGTDGNRAHCMS